MMRFVLIAGLAGLAMVAEPAAAQGRGNGNGKGRNKAARVESRNDRDDDRYDRDGRYDRDDRYDRDGRYDDRYDPRYDPRYDSRRSDARGVPPGHLPPPGMCRVWIDGVPPGRQPRVTDCRTAERNRPSNGRVIYGSDVSRPGNGKAKGKYDRRDRYEDRRDRYEDRRDRDDDWWERERDRDRRDACVDRDRDGRCDASLPGGICTDRDRDGRCDIVGGVGGSVGGYPVSLPDMIGRVLTDGSARARNQQQWLGRRDVRASFNNTRGVRPGTITWRDPAGETVQVWLDQNHDGRADEVQLYQDGRLVSRRR